MSCEHSISQTQGNKLEIDTAKSIKSWQCLKAASACCISQKALTWKQVLLQCQPRCFLYNPQVGQEEELFSENGTTVVSEIFSSHSILDYDMLGQCFWQKSYTAFLIHSSSEAYREYALQFSCYTSDTFSCSVSCSYPQIKVNALHESSIKICGRTEHRAY